jgi:uncharacterized protein with PIN domain
MSSFDMSSPVFVADSSLHRVAKHLRLMGLDCVCKAEYSQTPMKLIELARRQNRIILTVSLSILDLIKSENDALCKSGDTDVPTDEETAHDDKSLKYFFIKGADFQERLLHIVKHFGFYHILHDIQNLHPRCLDCNNGMRECLRCHVQGKLDASIVAYYKDFWFCDVCGSYFYGLREKLLHACKHIETKNYCNVVISGCRHQCTFKLSRVVRWLILCWLRPLDIYHLMQCSKSMFNMATDNIFWKWNFERQLHLLMYETAMLSFTSRKMPMPFGHTPWQNPSDAAIEDPPTFWIQQYRQRFCRRDSLPRSKGGLKVMK